MGLITNIYYAFLWDGMKGYSIKVGRVTARLVVKNAEQNASKIQNKTHQYHRIKLLKNTD